MGVQRADHLVQDLGGHVRIDRCCLQRLVAQHHLDHADVDLLFQQVRGNVWRSVCMVTRLSILAASAAS